MTATITDADRAAAHANIAAHGEEDCDYWRGSWVGRSPKPEHQPVCDRLAQVIADARNAENLACEGIARILPQTPRVKVARAIAERIAARRSQ